MSDSRRVEVRLGISPGIDESGDIVLGHFGWAPSCCVVVDSTSYVFELSNWPFQFRFQGHRIEAVVAISEPPRHCETNEPMQDELFGEVVVEIEDQLEILTAGWLKSLQRTYDLWRAAMPDLYVDEAGAVAVSDDSKCWVSPPTLARCLARSIVETERTVCIDNACFGSAGTTWTARLMKHEQIRTFPRELVALDKPIALLDRSEATPQEWLARWLVGTLPEPPTLEANL